MHYHFIWDCSTGTIKGKFFQQEIPGFQKKNFPYKCFYNDEEDVIYCFYRGGEFFNMPRSDIHKVQFGKCTDMSLGDMYLVFNKLLVARSS